MHEELPIKGSTSSDIIDIPSKIDVGKEVRIGITSWQTRESSWVASISGNSDPDKKRFERLNRLLNQVISCQEKPKYLVFPELSIPAKWILAIAGKLLKHDISLICGIEYLHAKRNRVHNQVWAALSYDAFGFPVTIMYRQDKQHPAIDEERKLSDISGSKLKPQLGSWTSPPIINHGGFQFAILICSELTNIAYRTSLRGAIDALFIPEWNKDVDTFNSLVESAALDVHAYIVQCNNRQYGDSRIRAPYKDSWERDIIRVKGGIEDYFITGLINIHKLRIFQSSRISSEKSFKPVPNGFVMSRTRRVLPYQEEITGN